MNPLGDEDAGAVPYALEALAVSKRFPGVLALDGATLRLRPGKLTALLGENGAGKSTLMGICGGVTEPDSGRLLVNGRPVRFRSPQDAGAHGIAVIHQELSLASNLSVAENIFLGREPRTRLGFIDYHRLNREAAEVLQRLRLSVRPEAPVGTLRVGQQQVVEIARAIATQARILIMDEPTSALSHQEIEALLALVARLKSDGVAIAYITHKFEELTGLCDDVVVLRDGRVVADAPHEALPHDEIVRLMIGREVTSVADTRSQRQQSGEVLRVDGLSLSHATRRGEYVVRDLSFHVCRGEVLGIFGLMGAGRTELLEAVFGAHTGRSSGRVFLDGTQVHFRSPFDAVRAGVCLAPEDRKRDGLVLEMSIRSNGSLASLQASQRWGLLARRRELARLQPLLSRLRLRAASLEGPVRNLSGGNQQKVILAKWLATSPRVLLLDEPTRGIDVNAKGEIHALIDELARDGLAVVLVSSELPEVLAVSDRIIVMSEGRKTAEFTRDEATAEAVMHAALPRPVGAAQSMPTVAAC